MTNSARPRATGLVVLCYALCGPAIGTFTVLLYAAITILLQSDPTPNHGHNSYVGLLVAISFALPFGYIIGALPAVATGLASIGVTRISARWGCNPFVSGLIGATICLAMFLLAIMIFRAQEPAPTTGHPWYLWPVIGFIAGFCCHGIAQHFERKAALPDCFDDVNKESVS